MPLCSPLRPHHLPLPSRTGENKGGRTQWYYPAGGRYSLPRPERHHGVWAVSSLVGLATGRPGTPHPVEFCTEGSTDRGMRATKRALEGVPTQGDKMKSGCYAHAFSAAHMWAEWLHKPCRLGGPQNGDINGQRWAGGEKPLRAVANQTKEFGTTALLGGPQSGDKMRRG